MSRARPFACVASVPIGGTWSDESELSLLKILGRAPNFTDTLEGEMRYWFYCECISSARLMADAARQISGVKATARER